MRGYEIDGNIRPESSILSYESPCGVMSSDMLANVHRGEMLRIPMRGYESITRKRAFASVRVTNPHAGL